MISVILLAAGESERMGKLKQLLPFRGSTILEHAIDCFLHSELGEVIVVLGYKAEEIKREISAKPVKVVVNMNYQLGMSTSIIKGLSLVDQSSEAIMIAFGDQPFLEKEIIDNLIRAFQHHRQGIVIPMYQGIRGHPVIFDIKYKDDLSGLTGDVGGKQIIDKHLDDVLEIETGAESVIADIDTRDDYQLYLH